MQDMAKCPKVKIKMSVSLFKIKNIRDFPIRREIAIIIRDKRILDTFLSYFLNRRNIARNRLFITPTKLRPAFKISENIYI